MTHGEGGVVGPKNRREDHPDPEQALQQPRADDLPRRLAARRITDQVQMFPGRRGAGRIFHTQVKLSGIVRGVRPVRAERRRWRVHPVVLRAS